MYNPKDCVFKTAKYTEDIQSEYFAHFWMYNENEHSEFNIGEEVGNISEEITKEEKNPFTFTLHGPIAQPVRAHAW